MRLDLVSQVFCLRAKEQAALEKAPRARTDVQLAKASEFLARAEAARERDQAELRVILAAENEKGFGLSGTAVRIPTLTTACLDWLLSSTSSSEDKSGKRLHPVSVAYESTENCARLRQAGWYLPPEAQDTEPYPGLVVERAVNLAPHFCFEPRKEDLPSKQVHLASYVGEGDGYLSPALEQAARYLDDGFDGLCIHAVPTLQAPEFNKRLKDFALAVVLGPSGSGKTALACERFGGPLVVQWSDEVSALAHFVSFERGKIGSGSCVFGYPNSNAACWISVWRGAGAGLACQRLGGVGCRSPEDSGRGRVHLAPRQTPGQASGARGDRLCAFSPNIARAGSPDLPHRYCR